MTGGVLEVDGRSEFGEREKRIIKVRVTVVPLGAMMS